MGKINEENLIDENELLTQEEMDKLESESTIKDTLERNESSKEEYMDDNEYYNKLVDDISDAIQSVIDESRQENIRIEIKALQDVLEHRIRMSEEKDIIGWVLNETEDPNEIAHRISNRKESYWKEEIGKKK